VKYDHVQKNMVTEKTPYAVGSEKEGSISGHIAMRASSHHLCLHSFYTKTVMVPLLIHTSTYNNWNKIFFGFATRWPRTSFLCTRLQAHGRHCLHKARQRLMEVVSHNQTTFFLLCVGWDYTQKKNKRSGYVKLLYASYYGR